jgi:hypothetical protein
MLVCLVFYFGALCGLLRLFSCFQPGLSGIRYFVILGCIFSSTLINDRADAFYLKKRIPVLSPYDYCYSIKKRSGLSL